MSLYLIAFQIRLQTCSHFFCIDVVDPPILVGKTPPTVQGCLNGEAEIPCKFNGNPKPSLKWGKLVEFDNPITGIVNVTTDETENVKEYIAIPPEINHAFRKGSDDSLILHVSKLILFWSITNFELLPQRNRFISISD